MVGPDRGRTEAAAAEELGRTGPSGAEVQNQGEEGTRQPWYLPAGLSPGMRLQGFPKPAGLGSPGC